MPKVVKDSLFTKDISRREILKLFGGVVAASMLDGLIPRWALSATIKRPNIIFILSDDHRWDHMSCMGHPFLKTPNLDRLASQGVMFDNAFVTTSLCSPSRASFLTGQYAHIHGVKNNITPWNNENVTFLEQLKRAGYDTAFIGKWHMPGKGLPDLRGLDRFISFTIQRGQGRYFNCPLIVDGVDTPSRKEYITEELTDYALEFVKQKRDNPFCLYLSLKAVHHRWLPPKDLKGIYSKVEDLHFPPEADNWIGLTDNQIYYGTFGSLDKLYRGYCETIVAMDRELGRVLNTLDSLGLTDNTVVIYASDNGIYWGEHRLVDKRFAYEEAIRIPFIVRWPGLIKDPGGRLPQMVLNIDLAPTILELAGVTIPENMQGKSIVPLLASKDVSWRRAWLYEYFLDFPYIVPGIYAIRTEDYKYIEYQSKRYPPEVYNISLDPKEKNNLYEKDEAKKILPILQQELIRLKKETGVLDM
ncbi:MAG: sulfatase [Deltaproteobacteria bacterium]|nr:sulfatase [Deltaproteobacteria bacterium]